MHRKIYKVAFCGSMGSGKTAASMITLGLLTDHFGADNSIGYVIKFAQPIYQSLLAFHRPAKNNEERVFMQRLGDLARRQFGDNVFEKIFEENINGLITNRLPELSQTHVLVAVDDLRFLGEYKLVKQLGFTIVRIEAPDELRKQRLGSSYTAVPHRSELEQQLFIPDLVVANEIEDVHMQTFEAGLKKAFSDYGLFDKGVLVD